MPRPPKPTYIPPRKGRGQGCWISRAAGPVSEKSGRRVGVRNSDIGPDSGRDGPANRRKAQEWLDGLLAEQAAAIVVGENPTLDTLCPRFLDDCRARKLAARTIGEYERRLKMFVAFKGPTGFYGLRPARDFGAGDLTRWIKAMRAKGLDTLYINSILISVNALFSWASRPDDDGRRLIPAHPFAGVRRPKNPRPPKRYCGPVARRAFLEYALLRAFRQPIGSPAARFDRLTVALFRLAEASGCRPDEACRLEWSQIRWEDATAVLRGKSTSTTGSERVVPLADAVVRLLRIIQRLPGRHPRFVFTHAARDGSGAGLAGVPWTANALAHKFKAWRDEAIAIGQPIAAEGREALTMYAFRRDLGADILRLTGSHAESAEVLGHSPEINARHYASFESERAVNLARRVAEDRSRKPDQESR